MSEDQKKDAETECHMGETLRCILRQTKENSAALTSLHKNTAEMSDILQTWRDAKDMVRTINRIGAVSMWLGKTAIVGAAILYYIKTGNWKL